MKLAPMRYKDYVWPHNPRVYSIDYERKMAVNKVPFGTYHLQDLGRTRRVMRGEGEFAGEGAYSQFGLLANTFYDPGPGLLIHPLWQTASAYFVELRLEQEPRPDYVRYSFAFWEASGLYSGAVQEVTRTGEAASGGSGGVLSHTVEQVEATDFLRLGGRCRRVMTMPGRSSYQAMRYSGQFQLDRSAAELVRMEAVVPVLFYGKPGDLVRIQRSDWDRNGSWRVVEASVQADEAGGRTRLELAVPDVVI